MTYIEFYCILENRIYIINMEEITYYKPSTGTIIGGKFIVGSSLGEGRYAHVVSGQPFVPVDLRVGGSIGTNVAVKIFKHSEDQIGAYQYEFKILAKIGNHPNIIQFLETVATISIQNGTPYVFPCLVFEKAGDTISDLIRYCEKKNNCGIPIEHTQKIMHGLLSGLSHIHANGVTHGDIKPSNLLLDRSIESIQDLNFNVKLIDFGGALLSDDDFNPYVFTYGYSAPEVLFGARPSPPSDIWGAFVSCFRMITGEHLIDIYSDNTLYNGSDIETEPIEEPDSDDSVEEDEDAINYRTLVVLEKILGPIDKNIRKKQRKYYNARGFLKNNTHITPIGIGNILRMNFDMSERDINSLEEFLLAGIKYDPAQRVTASDSLILPWLKN